MIDTTRHAAEVQARVLRQLSPLARLELAVEMSAVARALLRARLRGHHPEWSDGEVDQELLRHTIPGAVLPPLRR